MCCTTHLVRAGSWIVVAVRALHAATLLTRPRAVGCAVKKTPEEIAALQEAHEEKAKLKTERRKAQVLVCLLVYRSRCRAVSRSCEGFNLLLRLLS
jgi:hypothetical protein